MQYRITAKLTNRLFSYNVEHNIWTVLSSHNNNPPTAFHGSVIVGNYFVVHGKNLAMYYAFLMLNMELLSSSSKDLSLKLENNVYCLKNGVHKCNRRPLV